MMKLSLFATLQTPISEDDWDDAHQDFRDQLDDLKKKADVVVVTNKQGEKTFLGKANFNLGQCECCSLCTKSDVVQYNFYKVI